MNVRSGGGVKVDLKKSMRKGLCNDEASTSTLDRCHQSQKGFPSPQRRTLEEMIMKLEMEEEKKKRRSLEDMIMKLEMEEEKKKKDTIVMCARDALNQYPRFSLDGKDAMYRSSFRDQPPRRSSVCCDLQMRRRLAMSADLPPTVAGERVVWCKPGVVARLMGLEAMPVPLILARRRRTTTTTATTAATHHRPPRHF